MGVESELTHLETEVAPRNSLSAAEKVALSLALSQLVTPCNTALQGILTLSLAERLRSLPENEVRNLAVGFFFLASLVSFLWEVGTLNRSDGLSINTGTVIAYLKTKHPEISATLGFLYGNLFYLTNPVDIGSSLGALTANDTVHTFLTNLFQHLGLSLPQAPGQERLFVINLISRTAVGTAASLLMNYAIRRGYANEIVNSSKRLIKNLKKPFKRNKIISVHENMIAASEMLQSTYANQEETE